MSSLFDMESFDQDKVQLLDDYIGNYVAQNNLEALIPALYKAQTLFGYLPAALQRHIAEKLDLPSSHVNGVVSFYAYFSEVPKGKYAISVCTGTACHVKGASDVLNKAREVAGAHGETMSDDGLFSVNDVRCIGACGLAPVVTINGKVHGKINAKDMEKIIQSTKEAENA